jgi:carboxymethylenebutenolidase
MTRTEEINAGRVCGLVAHAAQPRAGVLVLPTITAVDAPMRDIAGRLAAAGFTAMVWNPYPGEATPADMPSAQARAAKLDDGAVDGMSDCVSYLLGTLRLPVVAALGFCLGGRYAITLAGRDKRLFACIAYYPSIRIPMSPNQTLDAVALAAEIECPVHLIHGSADQVLLAPVFAQVCAALEQRAAATVVQIHPGAVHSFMRPDLHSVPANAVASRLSWPPALAFLEGCLAQRMAAGGKIPA